MPVVKVANPAGSLLVVNGGKKMRKRKTTTARRRKANPTRAGAKRVSIKVNGRRGRRVGSVRRRRNPSALSGLGVIQDGFFAALGGLGTVWVRSMVPFQFGGAIGDAAITAGVAIGLGELVARFLKKPQMGKMITLGGVTVAVTNALQGFNLTPQALFSPKVVAVPKQAGGMGDIGLFKRTSYDGYYGSTVNPGSVAGMGDISLQRRRAAY